MMENAFITSNLIITVFSIFLVLILADKPIKFNLFNQKLYLSSLIIISSIVLTASSIFIYGNEILIDIGLWMFALACLVLITIIPIRIVYIGIIIFFTTTALLLAIGKYSLGEDFAIATLLIILVLFIKHALYEKISF